MTDEERDLSWLQGPPAADQIRFYLDSGDDVVFTEEQRVALENFLQSVATSEVGGFSFLCPFDFGGTNPCTNYTTCGPKSLCESKPICNPQSCNITNAMR